MTEAIGRIAAKAAEMTGADTEKALVVVEMTAKEAMARCRRTDMPPMMEAVVANIAADILSGADAAAVTVGDMSVTYGSKSPWAKHEVALYSWRRLA